MMNTAMNEADRRIREAEALAHGAGLDMDEERLGRLVESIEQAASMAATMERMAIEPTDLALEPFDAAWPEASGR